MYLLAAWTGLAAQEGPGISPPGESGGIGKDWFAGIGGGAGIYFGDHNRQMKFGERLSPVTELFLGKRWSSVFGARGGYSYCSVKGLTQHDSYSTGVIYRASQQLSKQEFEVGHLYGDILVDASNLLFGYQPSRIWSLSPYAGAGWMHAWGHSQRSYAVSVNVGILNFFRLGKRLALMLDVRGALTNDRFDREPGERTGEGLLTAHLGLLCNFGKR
jgi:hypothetical protein